MSQNPQIASDALIRPDEVYDAALGSLSSELLGDDSQEVAAICNAVSERICAYLERKLYIQSHTLYPDWCKSDHPSYALEWYVREWPAVQSADVAFGSPNPGAQLVYSNTAHESITIYCGYMREADRGEGDAETLTNLDISGLTTVPSVLPYEIRDVAVTLALIKIIRRREGREDFARKTTVVGSGNITVEIADPNAERRALSFINRYRHV